jgi:PAS domain S-box-containing protein
LNNGTISTLSMARKTFDRAAGRLHLLTWPLVILLAGSAMTGSVVSTTAAGNAREVHDAAQDAVDQVMVQVDALLQRYQFGLMAARGVIAMTGADHMDRATFLRYSQTRNDAEEFPGARGFGFIRRVAPDELDAYVARRRATGWPAFTLRQFQPHAGERAIIELIEPIAANSAVIGLDIASDPVRYAGAAAASANGTATLTAPIALAQDGRRSAQSFLLMLPVYGNGAVIGWTFAPLAIDEVLARIPGRLPDGAFTLADNTPGGPPVSFYVTGSGTPAYGSVRQSRRVLGRNWTATFQPSQAFVAPLRLPSPLAAGLAGAALTLLAAALAFVLAMQRARRLRLYATLRASQTTVESLNAGLEWQVAARTAELDAARRDLRTILDALPSMIGYWDRHQRNRFANRAYGEKFGMAPEAMAGRTMQELTAAAVYELNLPHVHAVLRGAAPVFERVVVGPDGVPRHYLAKYLPDVGAAGVDGFYVLVHDVSEIVASRQALALALRENDVLVRTINEQMLYSVTDAQGIIIEVNDNFCHAYGYRRDELIGVHYRMLSSDAHDRTFGAGRRETVTAGQTWQGTVCNRTADGAAKWFDTVVAPYFDACGAIERYVALHTDVTARHAADAELRHVSALLGNVLRAASEMSVIATDTDGLITLFNAGAERMLGYSAAELVGHSTPAPLHDPEEVAARSAELSRQLGQPVDGLRTLILTAEKNGAEAREWTYVRKDGSRFPVLLTVTAIRADSGAVLGFLGIGVDISQRKRDDAILRDSILRAEQASVAKSQFVANMSHEIRTPMNAMLGMLELMLRTDLSTRQRDYVDKARGAGATLMALLNDVLDFSKIDAGKLELDHHVFEVDVLLHDLAAVLTGNHVNEHVEVMLDIAATLPARLRGDRQRIGQVLVNLAGNALKFTHEGSVVVALEVQGTGAGAVALRCAVTDTGIGIPADQLGMIFDGFTQAEASTARRFGGTGLGLAISARIVALMGGTLQVHSEVGRGSRFWFDIVLGTVPDDAVAPPLLAMRRALVVDAGAQSGAILQRLLARTGIEAMLAPQTGTAVAMLAAAAAAGTPFDVVLLDARLATGAAGIDVPVILVGADGDELQTPAPVCAVLNKPVTPAELARALTLALAAPGTAHLPAPQVRQQRLAGLHLLVVEDNALNRQVAFELLASEGAMVDLAEGGQQGVDMATDPARAYDAIIMDVQMPDVDGLAATRRIRAVPRCAQLPIMAMTANASTADRDACLAAGMNSHIGKPFAIDEVVARLRALIERGAAPSPPPPITVEKSGALVDLAEALPRFLDDAGLYARLLANFERESGELLARLEQEQARDDTSAEGATIHALKGMALTMGFPRLAQALAAPPGSRHRHAALHALTATSIQAARDALALLA